MSNYKVTVLGAGLAGCEAALWLAGKGVQVELYEQKPAHFSPAHKSEGFAELICSNSLKAERLDSASGLLKEEMRRMGSQLLEAAEEARVAAGGASPLSAGRKQNPGARPSGCWSRSAPQSPHSCEPGKSGWASARRALPERPCLPATAPPRSLPDRHPVQLLCNS